MDINHIHQTTTVENDNETELSEKCDRLSQGKNLLEERKERKKVTNLLSLGILFTLNDVKIWEKKWTRTTYVDHSRWIRDGKLSLGILFTLNDVKIWGKKWTRTTYVDHSRWIRDGKGDGGR
ncbi:Hypothetical predicted protein [Paramuricea clavata]|uniref:Uncharacterized protein n=1 Tax=Paramuricea clavata TaxID=317549 RepID=A0A6S7G4V9_PARCT|nr:Hypothetical predicted protein [Paramuricea clavata]